MILHPGSYDVFDSLALAQFGFRYNPYAYLDSGADPHVLEYLVDNQAFRLAREEQPALVTAQPGSGKTAARIAVSRACLAAHSGRQVFPLILNLPDYFHRPDQTISFDEHLRALLRAGAGNLLLYYAFRPEQFIALPAEGRASVGGLLQAHLPLALDFYVDLLEQSGDPNLLIPQLEATYPRSSPPTARLVAAFAQALRALPDFSWNGPFATNGPFSLNGPLHSQFAALRAVLCDVVEARCVFVLVDGVDAFPLAGLTFAQQAARLVGELTARAGPLAQDGIYLKLFLPAAAPLSSSGPLASSGPLSSSDPLASSGLFREIHITWSEAQIVELLRRRVYAATEGRLDSLDAFAAVDVRGIEETLAREVNQPREAVFLAGKLLYNHLNDAPPAAFAPIHGAEVEELLHWYRLKQRPFVYSLNA